MQARQAAEEAALEEQLMEIKPPKPEVEKQQSTKKKKSKKQGKLENKRKNAKQVPEQLTSPLDNEIPEPQKSPLKQRIKDRVKRPYHLRKPPPINQKGRAVETFLMSRTMGEVTHKGMRR